MQEIAKYIANIYSLYHAFALSLICIDFNDVIVIDILLYSRRAMTNQCQKQVNKLH